MTSAELSISRSRLTDQIERLADFTDAPPPAVTRVLFTRTDLQARAYVSDLMEQTGLSVRQDACGNLFGRWAGTQQSLAPIATGSHCDAIPHAGRYDGTVGILGAIEAIRALRESGFQPRRSIDVILFTSEEPTRYGIGCLGSRLLSGSLQPQVAAALRDQDGETFETTRTRVGCGGSLDDVRLVSGAYHAFVELHIEQGPLLERDRIPIGIVTAIAAPAALRVTFEGEGGHAGAVMMADRNDALLPAAELALGVEQAALNIGGPDTVATVGVVRVHPGAINSIASRCEVEIDIRDIDLARRDQVLEETKSLAMEFANRRGVRGSVELINRDPPVQCSDQVISAIESASRDAGLASKKMVSRAYHDALFMALVAPTSMIFIPCRQGISHRPDEYVAPTEIQAGVEVLTRTLARLSPE